MVATLRRALGVWPHGVQGIRRIPRADRRCLLLRARKHLVCESRGLHELVVRRRGFGAHVEVAEDDALEAVGPSTLALLDRLPELGLAHVVHLLGVQPAAGGRVHVHEDEFTESVPQLDAHGQHALRAQHLFHPRRPPMLEDLLLKDGLFAQIHEPIVEPVQPGAVPNIATGMVRVDLLHSFQQPPHVLAFVNLLQRNDICSGLEEQLRQVLEPLVGIRRIREQCAAATTPQAQKAAVVDEELHPGQSARANQRALCRDCGCTWATEKGP
mmetsp:Transcript_117950/g.338276  ORF Transcript_117950/g.338276 Transcript_117950/m.338276 type:complete len:270 (+) Transcript_117950:414-1223(+)